MRDQPNLPRIKLTEIIRELCEQAGCTAKERKKHHQLLVHKHWNPHPPPGFVGWWQPGDRDKESGADIGGHPEARRQWARKESWGYSHRTYGTDVETAFNSSRYKAEYEAWVLAGSPEHPEPFESLACTPAEQRVLIGKLKALVAKIGRPMPEPDPGALSMEGVPGDI